MTKRKFPMQPRLGDKRWKTGPRRQDQERVAKARHEEQSTSGQHVPPKEGLTFRIRGVPLDWDVERLQAFLAEQYDSASPVVRSLAIEIHGRSRTATVFFRNVPCQLQTGRSWRISLPTAVNQSAGSLTLDHDFLGFTTLFAPHPQDHEVDIIAISGLGGHAFGSFKERGGEHMWLRDALPRDLGTEEGDDNPLARVMVYGYESHLPQSDSFQSLEDLGSSFYNSLLVLTTGARLRPIIFVAHSLGGLVVKQTLISLSKSRSEDDQALVRAVYGIVFFGVPHAGMDISSLIPMVGDGPNRCLLESIGNMSAQILSIQQREFPQALGSEGESEIVCFYETVKSPTAIEVEKGKWEMKGPAAILVTKASATHCRPSEDGPEHICAVNRTHSEMVKFGPQDHEYEKALVRIKGLVQRTLAKGSLRPQLLRSSQDCLESLDHVSFQDRRKALLDSLRFKSIDSRHENIEVEHAKTCKWLLDTPKYQDWLDPEKLAQHHGFLWINGKPGAGKSTLMKFAFTHARKTTEHAPIISFFFNARGEDLEKSTIGMYRSLLHQLLVKLPDLQELLDSSDLDLQNQSGSPTWDIKILRRLFSDATTKLGQRRLTCFIDALDECDQSQVRDMVEGFEELGQCAIETGTQLYFCFSSRHYPHIGVRHGVELTLEDQTGHAEDLEKYVRSKLRVGTSKSIEDIRTKILEKAHGIFMWAVLVVKILNEEFAKGRIFAVRKRLQEIPPELSKLFEDILTRDRENMADLLLCIQWILYAKWPLKCEEFYFAVVSGLDPDQEDLAEWDPDYIALDDMSRFVLSSSKGLAEITRSKGRTVQFIHESVRDYLIKDGGLRHLWPELGDDFESWSHDRLKKCCQTYMQVDISSCVPPGETLPHAKSKEAKDLRQRVSSKFPFLKYATDHILSHANTAASRVSQDDFLKKFFFRTWTRLINLFERHQIRRYDEPIGLLYVLAERNLPNLIKTLRRHDPRISIPGGRYSYPLFVALTLGHRDTVKALLEQEARPLQSDDIFSRLKYGPDFTFVKGQTPLWWAAENGHEAVVQLLLATDQVDVDTKDNAGWTPLLWAARNGHEAVVQLLLATDQVDVDTKDNDGRTPLLWAAENGHEAVVQLLLATDQVDVDTKDNAGRTSLLWAARNRHEAVIQLLLATDQVDVDTKDNAGWTPLLWAAEHGYEAVVQLLLATGQVDINTRDNLSGRTPLLRAARNGHEAVVQLLLATGQADMNIKDKQGETPLSWAASNGHNTVVKLLQSRL